MGNAYIKTTMRYLHSESRAQGAELGVAVEGAAAAGATVELIDLRELGLPMYSPDLEADPPAVVRHLLETCYEADGMLWSSPMYNGSVSGSFKNAIDWLHMLGSREPAYLHDEVIGLISAAGGTQGLQVVNTMEFSVRSLRGWAVPYVVPVPQATRVFADSGAVRTNWSSSNCDCSVGRSSASPSGSLKILPCTGRANATMRQGAS